MNIKFVICAVTAVSQCPWYVLIQHLLSKRSEFWFLRLFFIIRHIFMESMWPFNYNVWHRRNNKKKQIHSYIWFTFSFDTHRIPIWFEYIHFKLKIFYGLALHSIGLSNSICKRVHHFIKSMIKTLALSYSHNYTLNMLNIH